MDDINYGWLVGAIVPPGVAYAFHLGFKVNKLISMVGESLKMQNDPEKYGFGTSGLIKVMEAQGQDYKRILESQRDCLRELVHLHRFEAEERTGMKIPPYVREPK